MSSPKTTTPVHAHNDIQGSPIRVGSRVAYFAGGRYDSVNIATVREVRVKVKLQIELSSRSYLGPSETTWVDANRIVVLGDVYPEDDSL